MTQRKNPAIDSRRLLKTHCVRGHPYDAANTRYTKRGQRRCRQCCNRWMAMGAKRRRLADPEGARQKRRAVMARWMAKPGNRLLMKARREEWYLANKEWSRLRMTLGKYKLTLDEYHSLYERADFSCAICHTDRALGIDHDHLTGKVRHILCNGCNAGLGNFHEQPDRLIAAAQYLEARARVAT